MTNSVKSILKKSRDILFFDLFGQISAYVHLHEYFTCDTKTFFRLPDVFDTWDVLDSLCARAKNFCLWFGTQIGIFFFFFLILCAQQYLVH